MDMWTAFLGGAAIGGVAGGLLFAALSRRHRPRERAAEERASRAEECARRTEERASAGDLAGGLIHEVKNPLNSLSMNLQLLAEDWRDAETQKERRALKRIERLQSETARLAAILDEFMDFVRKQKLVTRPADVNQLVAGVVTFVRPEFGTKGIEIRTSYQDTPPCRLDVNLFKQALLNLLLNAEEAVVASATREIIVRTAWENGTVRIDVIDTGKGIAADDIDKVFEAFYSTRKGGTGLGLPTARRIIEQHGGSLAVHSDRGQGTCFTIRLAAVSAGEDNPNRGGTQ